MKSKHHSGGLGDSFMWHSLQPLEYHCSLLFPGYFVQLKVVMMPLIYGKLLEMLPLISEVNIKPLPSYKEIDIWLRYVCVCVCVCVVFGELIQDILFRIVISALVWLLSKYVTTCFLKWLSFWISILQVSLFLWHCFSGTTRKRRNNLHRYPEMKLYQGCLCAFPLIELLNSCSCETLLGQLVSTPNFAYFVHIKILVAFCFTSTFN